MKARLLVDCVENDVESPGPLVQTLALWVLVIGGLAAGTTRPLDCAGQERPRTAASRKSTVADRSERIPWTTSRITGSPDPPLPYTVEPVLAQLTFQKPTELVPFPGTSRLCLLELNGNIYTFHPESAQPDLFLDAVNDLAHNDRLLGLEFHPQFAKNQFCYLSYGDKRGVIDGRRISRFKVLNTDPPRCDPASEKVLISWTADGHTGGSIKFGPDGYLYVTAGDGGSAFPPDGNDTGQDLSDLQSSILRIDVDHPDPGRAYSVPEDNPFVGRPGIRPEIWAYGFRNPWKMSFDPFTGDLWTADVGWELWELVYRVERGGNYGWSVQEGRQPVRTDLEPGPTPILSPTVDHPHTESRSVTGGYTYRGTRFPELVGAYIYGDYVTGKIWGVRHDGEAVTWHEELADTALALVSFGEDHQGNLYLVDHAEGTLHRLRRNSQAGRNSDFPRRLSETGLLHDVPGHQPAAGVMPYQVSAEPWSDFATAERLVALPGTSTIQVPRQKANTPWQFPRDAVLAKTVSLELQRGNPSTARRLETQILHFDGQSWNAYSYAWNDQGTDAELVGPGGSELAVSVQDPAAPDGRREQRWRVASRTECMTCHTQRAGYAIGFNHLLLDCHWEAEYGSANQMDRFISLGILSAAPPGRYQPLCDPYDKREELAQRARAYLHINCAHCHRRGGGGNSPIELQSDHRLDQMRLLDAKPTQGAWGLQDARLVAPGDPYRSVLYLRMSKLGRVRMPHLGSTHVDLRGVELIAAWIEHLPRGVVRSSGPPPARTAAAAIGAESAGQVEAEPQLATPAGALRLLRAINTGEIDPQKSETIINRAAHHEDPLIRDLFERFLPADQRVARLGGNVDLNHLLSLRGDADRGRRIFFERNTAQCRNCHQVHGQGVPLGPDLSQVGKKYNRRQLLETLLEPSKSIDPKYVTYVVESTNGQVYTGLLVARTAEEVVLKDVQNQQIRVPTDAIHAIVPRQKSLMPDQMLRDMTPQDAADLLAYLAQLR